MAVALERARLTYDVALERVTEAIQNAEPTDTRFVPDWDELVDVCGWQSPSEIARAVLDALEIKRP